MPANLPPEYYDAQRRYSSASEPDEKLDALEDMLSLLPKHKGTDKIQADIRRRISDVKEEKKKKKKKQQQRKKQRSITIEREGSGQIMLLGPPNSGKTSILNEFSALDRKTGDYPFTTREPYPGMVQYKNVDIQLVDFPPLTTDYVPDWVNPLLRGSDGFAMVIDPTMDQCLEDLEEMLDILRDEKIIPSWRTSQLPPISAGTLVQPTVLIANKMDKENAEEKLDVLRELYQDDEFDPLLLSLETGEGKDKLLEEIWNLLGKIRVYSRPEGGDPDYTSPYTIEEDSTVMEFARKVHRDFANNLQYAKVWNHPEAYEGQRVPRDHKLVDEEEVQLCMESD